MSFTTLTNGIDTRLFVIRHDESGFYNITKTASLVHKLKTNNADTRGPLVKDWCRTNAANILLNAAAEDLNMNVEDLMFEVKDGLYDHRGTYIHPDLYDHFIMWLDTGYAFKISHILKKIHADANRVALKEKDDKIDILTAKIDAQSAQIAELLGYAKTTTQSLEVANEKSDVLETKVDGLSRQVNEVKNHLEEKSVVSTMNPSNQKLHHYALITV